MIPPQIQLSSQHLGEKDILLESEDRVEKIFPVLSECEDYKNLQENSGDLRLIKCTVNVSVNPNQECMRNNNFKAVAREIVCWEKGRKSRGSSGWGKDIKEQWTNKYMEKNIENPSWTASTLLFFPPVAGTFPAFLSLHTWTATTLRGVFPT